jgi:hypothetical protein
VVMWCFQFYLTNILQLAKMEWLFVMKKLLAV